MKELSQLLKKREGFKSVVWDSKSIFFAFQKVIKDEYGNQGIKNLTPVFFKEKKLFIKTGSSNWANELWANKKSIIEAMNQEINSRQIEDIKIDY
jgi:hypothetical protein